MSKSWSRKKEFNLVAINHGELEVPGVYIFWRKSNCVYVGISNNLRIRLTKHFESCHNDCLNAWIRSPYQLHFQVLEVNEKNHRHIRERDLIRRYDPSCNIAHT